MNTLYIDPSTGISGDKFVGALLELTGAFDDLQTVIAGLDLPGCSLSLNTVEKAGQKALSFSVQAPSEQPHRHYTDIIDLLRGSSIDTETLRLSLDFFRVLAEAEARVHDTPVEQVHFHEVGAVDSIVDLVSAAWLVQRLAPEQILSGPVAVGKGRVQFCHGETDLPVPAVRALIRDMPQQVRELPKELTTPTGAAILQVLVNRFVDRPPELTDPRTGGGAGDRDLPFPNVLTVAFGDAPARDRSYILLETQIDDMNPELYPVIIDRLVQAGALDALVEPCLMKKGRIGMALKVLARPDQKDEMLEHIFSETTTFGIRINRFHRAELDRTESSIETRYGVIRIKTGRWKGAVKTVSPEFEDCRAAAEAHGVPIRVVEASVRIKP